jgi:hypothetical protein
MLPERVKLHGGLIPARQDEPGQRIRFQIVRAKSGDSLKCRVSGRTLLLSLPTLSRAVPGKRTDATGKSLGRQRGFASSPGRQDA